MEAADLGTVEFSVQAGFYSDTVTLELTCGDPDAAIRLHHRRQPAHHQQRTLHRAPITHRQPGGRRQPVCQPGGRPIRGSGSRPTPTTMPPTRWTRPPPSPRGCTKTACWGRPLPPAPTGWGWNRTRCRWSASPPRPTICSVRRASICPGPPTIPCASTAAWTSPAISFSNEKIDARIQILDAGGSLLLDADTTVRVSGGWSRQSAQMKNLHLKLQGGAVSGILSAAPGGDALDTLVLRGQRKRRAPTPGCTRTPF